jgi:beta-lactamase regulating signal transducer with metallopeptidase domain
MSADLLALLARATLALSAAIVLVLALRAPLRAAFGAQIAYAFWAIVPIATLSSFIPARTIFATAESAPQTPQVAPAPLDAVGEEIASAAATLDWSTLLIALWLAGFVVSIVVLAIRQQRFIAQRDAGPAVVGVLQPRIIVPADFEQRFSADERALVLEHERAHIRAGDVQITALAAFIQCVNWFNPLAHIARAALRIDQELACDARVIARNVNARRAYAETMLKTQLAAHAVPLGCAWPPLAGAQPLKQRIAMLAKPAPTPARRALGALACAAATFALGAGVWVAQPPRMAYAQQNTQHTNRIIANALGAQLVNALKDGDVRQARELIDAGADVNQFIEGDGTPLIIAAQEGDAAMAHLLLEAGANVNTHAQGEGTALIVAAKNGDMDLVSLFVESGADVNALVRGDETPLINAARHNRLAAASYLIEHGADVNLSTNAPTINGIEYRSPLSMARRGGHSAMAALLQRHGARD